MKTKFYFLPILLLGGLSLFTACSDDDDEKGGGQPAAPVIGPGDSNSGARLTSISSDRMYGTYYFLYNEDGTVKRMFYGHEGEEYEGISITYNPFGIYSIRGMSEYKNVSFNQNGYLSHYSDDGNYMDEESEDWEKWKEDVRYSYNGNGNLTKYVNSFSYNGVDEGENYSGHGTYTITYSWEDGNLVKIQKIYNDIENGASSKHTQTYEFEYSDEVNKYQQFVYGIEDDNFDADYFAPIGWLGKWTKNYPSSCTILEIVEDEEGKDTWTDTYTWSNFSTTNDGLLSGFNYDGSRYTYTSDTTASTAQKVAAKQTLDNNAPSPRTKKMGRHHRRLAKMLSRK